MSMHQIPLTQLELDGLTSHGLVVGAPSQLSDAFRQGVAFALAAQSKKKLTADSWVGLSEGDAIAIADSVVRGNFVHTKRNIALRAAYETQTVLMGKNL
jgi:hypothetical protein